MLFSIIIPTHDRSAELRAALQSCLVQDFADFEVVVVDDFSLEPAKAVCDAFGDSRIVCLRNEANLGASASRNRALGVARGDFAVFLDSDDVYLPSKLSALAVSVASHDPDVILHKQYRVLDSRSGHFCFEILPAVSIALGEPIEEFTFKNGNFYNMNSIAVRREIYRQVAFRPEIRLYEDQAFVFDCVRQSRKTIELDAVLAVYVDDARSSRASHRFRSEKDFTAFLRYASEYVTPRGYRMIEAAVMSEVTFWRRPAAVLRGILAGQRAGVKTKRLSFYLFRSMFGTRIANTVRDIVRVSARSNRHTTPPDWAQLVKSQ
jgi:glycosyltransferase involved in cell wall biosynthesis